MKRHFARVVLLVLCWSLVSVCWATIEAHPFPDDELRSRYHSLISDLRCPQCLNTNLAGSVAMIALDLRREIHRMLLAGHSDNQIRTFLFERYGDFVLYRPRVTSRTILLWATPALLLCLGAFVFWRVVGAGVDRQRTPRKPGEAARLQRLLNDR